MSSLFTHLFIPVVIILLFSKNLKLKSKDVILLSFVTLFPDLDAFLFSKIEPISLHRALFHNVFILIIPLLFFIFVKNKRELVGIILLYLISHLIFDLFSGGIFLFYPLYNKVFFANLEILFNFKLVLEYGISDKIVNMGRGEPIISSENIAIAILLIFFAAISASGIYRKTKQE